MSLNIEVIDSPDKSLIDFFEKRHGYTLKWTQENYPKNGNKFFMMKNLV